MSHFLHCVPHDTFINIRIKGVWERKNSQDIIKEMFDLSEKHKGLPLLIDIRVMESEPSAASDFFDVQKFADAHFRDLGRIAVLDTMKRKDENDFFETAAHNRGLQFRFFYSSEEALIWLLQG